MATNFGCVQIASSNSYAFTNASNNDLVMYSTNPANQILIGAQCNAYANVTLMSSNISMNVMGNTTNSAIKLNVNNGSTNVLTALGTGNIGIGTQTPVYKLDVAGDINVTGAIRQNGTPYSGGGGGSSQWSNTSNIVFLMNSNVGIGTSNPSFLLDVNGQTNATTISENSILLSTKYAPSNTLSNYALISSLGSTYAPSNTLSNYALSSTLGALYAPSNTLSNYALSSTLGTLYAPSNTLSNYALSSTLGTLYAPSNTLSNYLLTSTASSTYALSNTMNTINTNVTWLSNNRLPTTGGTLTGPLTGTTITGTTINGSNANFSNVTIPGTLTVVNITDCNIVGSNIVMNKYFAVNQFLASITDTPAEPGYSWSNDVGTGIYHPTNCNIGFSVGGVEAARILSNGNLGIGKSNPAYKLDVTGDINLTGTLRQNGVAFSGGGSSQWSNTSNIVFLMNSNVGIGTSNSVNKLSVNGTASMKNLIVESQKTPISIATEAVSTWTARTSAVNNLWYSVCWSPDLSLFVAVSSTGTGNRVMTSPNGINWTSRASAADNNWQNVCWSPELSLFVAVSRSGTNNRVMTSSDGISWTSRNAAAENSWNSVCWSSELYLFVAVSDTGTGNRVMTSPDGINWTSRASAADVNWLSVCWSPELSIFVAVGWPGNVMTSPNGINWTSRTSPNSNNWYSVCWSPELSLFVAVGGSGTGNRVMTSPDGITWTSRTSAADNSWNSVCWSPELSLFVAVSSGTGTGNRVMTSTDGITWISRASAADNTWYSICWSPQLSIFVAVNISGVVNDIMTSKPVLPAAKSTLIVNPSYMTVNNATGRVGINNANPTHLFDVNGQANATTISENSILLSTKYAASNTLSNYALISSLGSTYAPSNTLSNYALISSLGSTYAPSNTLSNYLLTSAANTTYGLSNTMNTINTNVTWLSNNRLPLSGGTVTGEIRAQAFSAFTADGGAGHTSINIVTSSNTSGVTMGLAYGSGAFSADASVNDVVLRNNGGKVLIQSGIYNSALCINTLNNVGIGKSNPSYKLDVTGDINLTGTLRQNGVAFSGGGSSQWSNTSNIVFLNSNVGIGTSNSVNKLSVNGTASMKNLIVASQKTPISIATEAVSTWTLRSSAVSNALLAVCWSPQLSIFVAVAYNGAGNRVRTSPDGITWTTRTSAEDISWNSVCWSPELSLFVAVASNGTGGGVMTSPNGINWTSRVAVNNSWQSVCWSPELSLFVAVSSTGIGNRVMTSPDGITWTSRTSAADNLWYSVCWSPELSLFVAVSQSGTGNRVMTSQDGITWTSRAPAADNDWRSVCWSPELSLFVAVSGTGTGNRVMTSPNGITWTSRTSAVDNEWRCVCWSPELSIFVAVASSGTDHIMISPDGINWTPKTSAAVNTWWMSVCWSPQLSIFVAVAYIGTGNNLVMTSKPVLPAAKSTLITNPSYMNVNNATGNVGIGTSNSVNKLSVNGTASMKNLIVASQKTPISIATEAVSTWTSRTSAVDNNWRCICWSSDLSLFVAVGDLGTSNRVMTSPDGLTWTTRTSAADNSWASICWSSELSMFAAVSDSGTGNRVMTSPDGIAWTSRTSAADNNWAFICWSSELSLFVAVSASGVGNRVMTSSNGLTWTSRTSASDCNWRGVCWSPELSLFVAVGSSSTNRVMTSPDGINWTSRSASVDNTWRNVCWSPELSMFAAVSDSGTGNRVMTSPDGIAWTTRTSPADSSWYFICWSPELSLFIATGDSTVPSNRLMTSANGITWTIRSASADNNWQSICWSPELSIFAAVSLSGAGNRVMTSKPVLPNAKSSLITNPSHMTVNASSGNVGIGTQSPAYKLDIVGDMNFTGTFRQNGIPILSNYALSSTLSTLYAPSNTLSNYLLTSSANTTYGLSNTMNTINTNVTWLSNNHLSLSGGTLTGALTGTTITANTVNGSNANFSNVTIPGTLTVVNITDCNIVGSNIVMNKYFATNQFLASFNDTVAAPGYSWSNRTGTGLWLPNGDSIGFCFSGVERVRMTPAGNVGIGTSNPQFKLDVNGQTNITGTIAHLGSAVFSLSSSTLSVPSNTSVALIFDPVNSIQTTKVCVWSGDATNRCINIKEKGVYQIDLKLFWPPDTGRSSALSGNFTLYNHLVTSATTYNSSAALDNDYVHFSSPNHVKGQSSKLSFIANVTAESVIRCGVYNSDTVAFNINPWGASLAYSSFTVTKIA